MEALGQFLRKGREKAGVTLDELAQRTRIRVENLESLEKEDLDNLPSDAYVRGFVRLVCREIGLSPHEGLVRYEMLRARSGPPDEITWAEERVDDTPGRLERVLEDPERVVRIARNSYRWAGIALGAGAVALVLVFGWRVLRGEGASDSSGSEGSSAAPQETSHEVSRSAAGEAGSVSPAAPASVPEAGARDTKPASPPASVQASAAIPSPLAQVDPAPTREPAKRAAGNDEPAPPRDTLARETAGSAAVPPSAEMLLLEVVALRPVDVTVLLDGAGQPRRASLATGERRQWKASRFFEFTATDGGAVRLALDGRDLGAAGDDGRGAFRTLKRSTR